MNYKYSSNTDDFPRTTCAGCGLLVANYGQGFDRCASCTYGASFSKSSGEARTAIDAHGKRQKLRVVPRPSVRRANRVPGVNAFGEVEIRDSRLC